MISVPFAHIGGIPIEETLGSLGPALVAGLAVAWANLRSRLRLVRSRPSAPAVAPRLTAHGSDRSRQ
jgi:hypothetical protein